MKAALALCACDLGVSYAGACRACPLPVSHQYANGDEELELSVESTAQVEGGQLRQEQGANLDCYAHTCRHKQMSIHTFMCGMTNRALRIPLLLWGVSTQAGCVCKGKQCDRMCMYVPCTINILTGGTFLIYAGT